MITKIYFFLILLIFFLGIVCLVLTIIKLKKWDTTKKIVFLLLGIILFYYSTILFKKLSHFNQIASLDKTWLKIMFVEYVRKYNSLPKTYDDLKKSTDNVHTLLEKDYFLFTPRINFFISNENDSTITVTYYEYGYDKEDNRLRSVIKSPISIFCFNIKGDFLIDVQKYDKDLLYKTKSNIK